MAERLIELTPAPATKKIAFIDLEASGLGSKSWPVEVGFAFIEGAPQSTLIRPDATWSDEAWDKGAEALHGLTRAELDRDGQNIRDVCRSLNKSLAGAEVYSDAPDWDGFWLFRLFMAANMRQQFAVHDFGKLIRPIAGSREGELQERAARLAPRRHRTNDDVRHLQTLYGLAVENCGPRLTR
ncbi:MAG TPA: hypothetical protein PLV61_08600 [Parvularculaceae bacterium]|nr:hypothetical protein [Amphiplicatus sp.]MCB9955736.1 hypothetical protein [Caulobacterales bacterium]HOP19096.1 hypothetical protein [Amphiplicatus sp.]HPE31239.1 hypothetical protein [Parvularculaceae bacterium]HRX39803.1 hypothetical protein [Parvularculaceae bacterium]